VFGEDGVDRVTTRSVGDHGIGLALIMLIATWSGHF
jgi:hypothetical protein